MAEINLLFVGDDREMAPLMLPITDQFPDIRCRVASRTTPAAELVGANSAKLVIFYWRGSADRPAFDMLAQQLKAQRPNTSLVVVTDKPCSAAQHHTTQNGAVECLCLPINVTRLVLIVSHLAFPGDAARPSSDAPKKSGTWNNVILQSRAMLNLLDSMRRAARSHATVLLSGESGTGKNLLASLVHQLSPRRNEPLVTVDCGASSETLIESDLFGHVRGAFTGADRDHVGKLERAGGGTLLLDEINSLPLRCQAKLLRVLEERVYEKVGDEKTKQFTGRVIALTNSSLREEVAAGRFRQDLYYRLDVIAFDVPPLRERTEDIAGLAYHFVEQLSAQNGRPKRLADEALLTLLNYSWPGNVRELRNVIERGTALSYSDLIDTASLRLPVPARTAELLPSFAGPDRPLNTARLDGERRELLRVLEESGNNRTRAAGQLGISRSALYKRLAKLRIDAPTARTIAASAAPRFDRASRVGSP